MYGEWLRVSPAELERAKGDLPWARDLAEEIAEAEDGISEAGDAVSDPAARRKFGTDKTWHALDFLLTRKGFPVSIVFGEELFVEDLEDPEADWGYGAPCYLTPDQVRQAASALAGVSESDLIEGVDQSELEAAEIYPSVWDRPGELEWAVCHLSDVKTFFNAAANSGDAIICWIG